MQCVKEFSNANNTYSPIELGGADQHLEGTWVPVQKSVAESLSSICRVTRLEGNELAVAELSRDWWPLALHWALEGEVGALAAVVVHPTSTEEVSQVMSVCHDAVIPVTAAGGRSGVCGGSIPVHGGVVIDLSEMNLIIEVDEVSGIVTAQCGVFGPDLEHFLRSKHSITVGHHPQSFDLSTVGGWVACRGAGQYSTRYGKIEEMVVGLEVVLADGSIIHTGGHAAGAVGPDLNHVFIGSEGTLGIITSATLRTHRRATMGSCHLFVPHIVWRVRSMPIAIRHEATPAVLRLYDPIESARSHGGDGEETIVLVLDEGHQRIVDATLATVDEFFMKRGGSVVEHDRVERLEHRNDTTALQGLPKRDLLSTRWKSLCRGRNLMRSIRRCVMLPCRLLTRSLLLLIFRTAISMEPACTSALRHGHLETHRFQKLTPSTELCGMSLNGPPFVLERTCRTTMVWV